MPHVMNFFLEAEPHTTMLSIDRVNASKSRAGTFNRQSGGLGCCMPQAGYWESHVVGATYDDLKAPKPPLEIQTTAEHHV